MITCCLEALDYCYKGFFSFPATHEVLSDALVQASYCTSKTVLRIKSLTFRCRSEDIFRSSDSEHPGCHTKDQHYKQIAEALEFCFLWEAYTLRLRGSLHIPDAKGGTHHFLQTVAEHILLGIGQFLRFCNCRMQENSIRNVRGLTSSLSVEVWGVSPTTFSVSPYLSMLG